MCLYPFLAFSQVGINTTNPNVLTELEIQNLSDASGTKIPKGIMVPRMTELERNSIDTTDPEMANSLLVYNTDEDCYNYFNRDRSEWVSLCGAVGKSTFTFDCSDVEVVGSYVFGKQLNPSANYLRVTVTVSKAGTYNIAGTTTNGYAFSASGEFATTGTFPIIVQGMGTPAAEGTDKVTLTNNGVEVACDLTIQVLPDAATFDMDCNNYTVNGIYEVGRDAKNQTQNYIDLTVTVTELGSWIIETDEIDGLSFSGFGTFTTTGAQTVKIYATGTPTNIATKNFTLTTNTLDGQQIFCKVKVFMVLPRKTILSLGTDRAINYVSGGNLAGTALLLNNPVNFGALANSTFKTYQPQFRPQTGGWGQNQSYANDLSASQLQPFLAPTNGDKPVDIIWMAYDADFDRDCAQLVVNFLRKGGVVVMLNEHMYDWSVTTTHDSGNSYLFELLYPGKTKIDNNDIASSGTIWTLPFVPGDDGILNGPFGDVREKKIGEDGGATDGFSVFDTSVAEWYVKNGSVDTPNRINSGTEDYVIMFKAKDYNLFWCGDAGLLAYNAGNTSNTSFPVNLDANQKPTTKPYGYNTNNLSIPVYNSFLGANVLAWALQTAEEKGINSGNF